MTTTTRSARRSEEEVAAAYTEVLGAIEATQSMLRVASPIVRDAMLWLPPDEFFERVLAFARAAIARAEGRES